MPKQPETLFKEKVLPILRKLPRSWWFKAQMVAFLGIPDIIGCLNGTFVALELKRDKKSKASKLQAYVIHQIIKAGGLGLVVSPENWDQVYSLLGKMSRGALYTAPAAPALDKLDS